MDIKTKTYTCLVWLMILGTVTTACNKDDDVDDSASSSEGRYTGEAYQDLNSPWVKDSDKKTHYTRWECILFGSYPTNEVVSGSFNAVDDYALGEEDVIVDATLYTRTDQGDPNAPTHTFDLLVNGQTFASDVIWRAYNIAPENSPTRFTHTIPAGVLTNGMNCVAWHKTSSDRWIKCACYRLTFDKIPNGTTMIVR